MASFGAKLKQEREKRGVTLEDISRSTKIGTRLLRALEEDHFDQLPGGIFNKGFIRSYARVVGINEEDAIEEYLAATGGGPPDKGPEDHEARVAEMRLPEPPTQPTAGLPWGTFAIVLLIVAVGFVLWGFRSQESQKKPPQAVSAPTASESAPSTTVAQPPQAPQAAGTTESMQAKPASPQATLATSPTSTASQPSMPAPTPASASVAASSPAASLTPSGSFRVLIIAREDSWISITVDGEVTTENTLIAPARKSVTAEKEIVIKAGNAGGLDFEFDGKKLPAQGNHGEVKTLTFNSNGLQPPAAAAPATAPEP